MGGEGFVSIGPVEAAQRPPKSPPGGGYSMGDRGPPPGG
jgi:hypothetical protein